MVLRVNYKAASFIVYSKYHDRVVREVNGLAVSTVAEPDRLN
jgi:hypothetical protein